MDGQKSNNLIVTMQPEKQTEKQIDIDYIRKVSKKAFSILFSKDVNVMGDDLILMRLRERAGQVKSGQVI